MARCDMFGKSQLGGDAIERRQAPIVLNACIVPTFRASTTARRCRIRSSFVVGMQFMERTIIALWGAEPRMVAYDLVEGMPRDCFRWCAVMGHGEQGFRYVTDVI